MQAVCEGYKQAGKGALPQELSGKAGWRRERHIPQREGSPSQKAGETSVQWLDFTGRVISWANNWEDYSNYLAGISTTGPRPFLAFYGQSCDCHEAVGVMCYMVMCYNEHIMRLKFYWKSDLPNLNPNSHVTSCRILFSSPWGAIYPLIVFFLAFSKIMYSIHYWKLKTWTPQQILVTYLFHISCTSPALRVSFSVLSLISIDQQPNQRALFSGTVWNQEMECKFDLLIAI